MMYPYSQVRSRNTAGQRRDWLFAGVAAGTLAISWYGAAALDRYALPDRAAQRSTVSAFDVAFVAANTKERTATPLCGGGECERLAEAASVRNAF